MAQACADTGGNCRGAAAFVPVRISNRATRGRGTRVEQWTAILLARVLDQVAAVLVGKLKRHGQRGRAQRRAIGCERALSAFLARIERHGGETTGLVKVVVDIVGIVGAIPGAKTRFAAQPRFDLLHQWVEIADVALVERTSALGQYELSAITQATGDQARGVAPQDLVADVQRRSRFGVTARGRWVGAVGIAGGVIAAVFDAQLAVFVAFGLTGLIQATFLDVLLGVVLLDPGQ